MELEELLLRWLTHILDKFVQIVGRRLQFLTTWTSPWGWLSVLTTWQLVSPERVTQQREQHGSLSVFHDSPSEVMLYHFCYKLFIKRESLGPHTGRGVKLHQRKKYQRI